MQYIRRLFTKHNQVHPSDVQPAAHDKKDYPNIEHCTMYKGDRKIPEEHRAFVDFMLAQKKHNIVSIVHYVKFTNKKGKVYEYYIVRKKDGKIIRTYRHNENGFFKKRLPFLKNYMFWSYGPISCRYNSCVIGQYSILGANHGVGVYCGQNCFATGNYKNGEMRGKGTIVWLNKKQREGYWYEDRRLVQKEEEKKEKNYNISTVYMYSERMDSKATQLFQQKHKGSTGKFYPIEGEKDGGRGSYFNGNANAQKIIDNIPLVTEGNKTLRLIFQQHGSYYEECGGYYTNDLDITESGQIIKILEAAQGIGYTNIIISDLSCCGSMQGAVMSSKVQGWINTNEVSIKYRYADKEDKLYQVSVTNADVYKNFQENPDDVIKKKNRMIGYRNLKNKKRKVWEYYPLPEQSLQNGANQQQQC